MRGFMIGLIVAMLLSVAVTVALGLPPAASFLLGLTLGFAFTMVGLLVDS